MTIRQMAQAGVFALLYMVMMLPPTQAAPQGTEESAGGYIDFNRDIRPILSDRCYTCHGPDKSRRMMNLRFDVEEDAKRDLGGGRFAIKPGSPSESLMVQRITSPDPARRMPPVSSGLTLTERDVASLRAWIQQGAKWQGHWSFSPPKRPNIPEVKDQSWPRNPIDHFVLERLEHEGLKYSPEADRATLIRRVTLDLTGLPPTLAEVDAFLSDKSPNAYEKVVDRLLQSPRYGERMAVPWLSAARYADSNGYLTDGERRMWRWRDWVIDAFNSNMSFDQFTIEQLAGDLLPDSSLDQKIATGFNRNHRINSEGGIIPEEFAAEYVADRVETTATTFLGVTLGCARCHDHKYDPFAQKEFYEFFALFNNIPEQGKARRLGNSPPVMKAPTLEQQAQLRSFNDRLLAARRAFDELDKRQLTVAQKHWEQSLNTSKRLDWGISRGLILHYPLNGDLTGVSVDAQSSVTAKEGEARFVSGRIGRALDLDGKRFLDAGMMDKFFRHFGYFSDHPLANQRLDDPFTLAAWIYPTVATGAVLTKGVDEPEPRGIGLYLKDGEVHFYNIVDWVDDGIRVESKKAVDLHQWSHVMVTYDGSRMAAGVKIYVNGIEQEVRTSLDDLNSFAKRDKDNPVRIGAGGGPTNRFQGRIDDVRAYNRELSAEEAATMFASAKPINEIVASPREQRSNAELASVREYFLESAAPTAIREAWKEVLELSERFEEFYEEIPTVMVMEEMLNPRETHVLVRGSYDQPGERVTAGVPAALSLMSADLPRNRLGLARWLVDASNPLTARVTVNRFWQMYFGMGLVKTAEDFGSQGEAPSHPALLDWLATEFVRTGWNVKALQKAIVTSSTYRQSSIVRPDSLQKDPENRFLSRGSSSRLSAEMIRDAALYLAGLLVEKIGGPSVKPYQPEGLWLQIGKAEYHQDHGEDLYRRSLYTFWKRLSPPPTMSNFDASSRDSCVVRLNRTNTPLQALDLMNNITFVEAARAFAQRIMKEGDATPQKRLDLAFRMATGRVPNPVESEVLLTFFTQQLDRFQDTSDSALKYVSHGEYPRDTQLPVSELAAYTAVCSLILNLDETITRE